jgi:hypothetical protein
MVKKTKEAGGERITMKSGCKGIVALVDMS